VIVLWSCTQGLCSETFQAYRAQSHWISAVEDNLESYGKRLQRDYVPDYAQFLATPVIGAVAGRGEIKLGGGKKVLVDIRRSALTFQWEY
jgi:hypothetical protein